MKKLQEEYGFNYTIQEISNLHRRITASAGFGYGKGETRMQKTVIRPAGRGYPRHHCAVPRAGRRHGGSAAGVFCEAPREEAEISSAAKAQDADFCWLSRTAHRWALRLSPTPGGRPRTAACCPPLRPAGRSGRRQRLTVAGASAANCWPPPSAGPGTGGWNTVELNVLAQNESAVKLYESQILSKRRRLCGVCCENRSVGAGHARPAGLRLHPFRG